MATTPRAGIINLNFKDVSEMAKNIADNDPWKTGIEAAGKVLTDRERYIMYQRALADAENKERPKDKTAGELIGSGIETVGKKIGEGADWLADKWKRLDIRSPFEESLTESTKTETPITETPSEKDSREMLGYIPNQAPIETDKYRTNLKAPYKREVEPNDDVYFGFNRDVGQAEEKPSPIIPFPTGEQVPEQTGVSVDFGISEPTSKLRSPFAMRTKEEMDAQEATSPSGSTEVAETKIKAPRMTEMEAWSEMNRLDPQRAAFDYNRVQNQKKSDIETMKALGKDANLDDVRAMHNAYLNNLTELYRQGAQEDDPRVTTAKKAIEFTGGLLADKGLMPKGEGKPTELTPEEKSKADQIGKDALIAGRAAIATAVDKTGPNGKPDGYADNFMEIVTALSDILANGVNEKSKEWGILKNEWEEKQKNLINLYDRAHGLLGEKKQEAKESREEGRQNKQDRLAQDKEYKPMWSSIQLLKNNPNDKTQKRATLNIALRVESGAAIAASEFDQMMAQTLPPAKYAQFKSETTGLLPLLASMTSPEAMKQYLASIAEKYLGDVDSNKLYSYVDAKIPDDYYKRKGGGSGAGGGGASGGGSDLKKPNAKDYPNNFKGYNDAMKKWKAAGGKQ